MLARITSVGFGMFALIDLASPFHATSVEAFGFFMLEVPGSGVSCDVPPEGAALGVVLVVLFGI
jgi:hypothetical protein